MPKSWESLLETMGFPDVENLSFRSDDDQAAHARCASRVLGCRNLLKKIVDLTNWWLEDEISI